MYSSGSPLGQRPRLPLRRRYLNAVQTTAQHLLRYLAAAVVVNKRRRNLLKDLVKVLRLLGLSAHNPAA